MKPWAFLALDIGNVCVEIHPERGLAALGYRSMAELPPELVELIVQDLERRPVPNGEFVARFNAATGRNLSESQLETAFARVIGDPIPGMVRLVQRMQGDFGIRPVYFSDTSRQHLAAVRDKFPVAEAVPEGIYSFEAGAKKPELAMFAAFEGRFGLPALYVDDRADLIDAARRHGWNARQFCGAEDLSAELEKMSKKHGVQR